MSQHTRDWELVFEYARAPVDSNNVTLYSFPTSGNAASRKVDACDFVIAMTEDPWAGARWHPYPDGLEGAQKAARRVRRFLGAPDEVEKPEEDEES